MTLNENVIAVKSSVIFLSVYANILLQIVKQMKYEYHLNDIFVKERQFFCKYTLQSNVYNRKMCFKVPSSKAWAELLFNLLV